MRSTAPSELLSGEIVVGMNTGNQWHVQDKIANSKPSTKGSLSVSYVVNDQNGKPYFLKATDQSLVFGHNNSSRLDRLADTLWLQKFEREMLEICSNATLTKVVHAIDFGEHEIVHNEHKEIIFFIIFEKAKGDIRPHARMVREFGLKRLPRFVHNLSVAVKQLHTLEITHNDIKPSNFLFYDTIEQKLSDLGRSTCTSVSGPFDKEKIVGDPSYLAPEQWGYEYTVPYTGTSVSHKYRKLCDIYMLGALIYFILTEASLNVAIITKIQSNFRPLNNSLKFIDILPHLENAHNVTMTDMKDDIIKRYGTDAFEEISKIIDYVYHLTIPNPENRGDPVNLKTGIQQYDLQRLISFSNALTKKLEKANE